VEIRVFIDSENNARFVCPECELNKIVDVSKYKNSDKAVRVKCKCTCGHSYAAILERRKFYRKDVFLQGTYTASSNNQQGSIIVRNLSRSGMRFELKSKSEIKVNDKMNIDFKLDDGPKSAVNKEVIVRSISGMFVGVEFTSLDHYDKLGPYLLT